MDGSPFFESCRAPEGSYDQRGQLEIAQSLDEQELSELRRGLREEGVDSSAWAARVLALEEGIAARTALLERLRA